MAPASCVQHHGLATPPRRRPVGPRSLLLAASLAALAALPVRAAELAAADAAKHVGENATVCGVVESSRYLERSPTRPTFLNLDRPYPNQTFTVIIFGGDRAKFGTPEQTFLHQRICATGQISLHEGRPEMAVQEPGQVVRK
jgi:hypothetical protein